MNNSLNNVTTLNHNLAHKFYVFSIGFYAAIACFFGSLYLLHSLCGLSQPMAVFIGYFIIVLARTFYDQLMLYELKPAQLNLKDNIAFACASACVFVILYHFLRAPMGDWAAPITIIIAMKVMAEIKKIIWTSTPRNTSKVLALYAQRFQRYVQSLYGLFIIIALVTYKLTTLYGIRSFYFALVAGVFLGLLFEQTFCYKRVYEVKLLTVSVISRLVVLALLFAILCSGLVFILMQVVGMSGKTAAIIGVITVKLTQPLISYRNPE